MRFDSWGGGVKGYRGRPPALVRPQAQAGGDRRSVVGGGVDGRGRLHGVINLLTNPGLGQDSMARNEMPGLLSID